jgi:hypothetical protein
VGICEVVKGDMKGLNGDFFYGILCFFDFMGFKYCQYGLIWGSELIYGG